MPDTALERNSFRSIQWDSVADQISLSSLPLQRLWIEVGNAQADDIDILDADAICISEPVIDLPELTEKVRQIYHEYPLKFHSGILVTVSGGPKNVFFTLEEDFYPEIIGWITASVRKTPPTPSANRSRSDQETETKTKIRVAGAISYDDNHFHWLNGQVTPSEATQDPPSTQLQP